MNEVALMTSWVLCGRLMQKSCVEEKIYTVNLSEFRKQRKPNDNNTLGKEKYDKEVDCETISSKSVVCFRQESANLSPSRHIL